MAHPNLWRDRRRRDRRSAPTRGGRKGERGECGCVTTSSLLTVTPQQRMLIHRRLGTAVTRESHCGHWPANSAPDSACAENPRPMPGIGVRTPNGAESDCRTAGGDGMRCLLRTAREGAGRVAGESPKTLACLHRSAATQDGSRGSGGSRLARLARFPRPLQPARLVDFGRSTTTFGGDSSTHGFQVPLSPGRRRLVRAPLRARRRRRRRDAWPRSRPAGTR